MLERIIIIILPMILRQLSPEIRKGMATVIASLKNQAAKTDNPIDDIFVEILEAFFQG